MPALPVQKGITFFNTFHRHRLLNPEKMKISQKIFIFSQKIDIYPDSVEAKLASVETFWTHNVT